MKDHSKRSRGLIYSREKMKNEDILRREEARVANALYTGLTDEEIERLRNWEISHSHDIGFEKGIEKGIEQGENNMITMIQYLSKQGRFDDLSCASEDKEFRERILAEMRNAAD